MNKDAILKILERPSDERPGARFNSDFLNPRSELSKKELSRIETLFPATSGISKRQRFSFLVNLAYASSKLEGNSYTQIDTETLLGDNLPAQGRSDEDTKMIINHKHAFDLIIGSSHVSRDLILQVHAKLADSKGVEGSRHFLDPEWCGTVRTFKDLWIGNTSYIPLVDYPGSKKPTISDYLGKIVEVSSSLKNPLEASFYLFTRLPYLQAFDDCNKRTSRLVGNLPLLAANQYPISFLGFDKANYNKGIIAFYEFGDTQLFKEGFINAYLNSALKFHGFSPKASVKIQSKELPSVINDLSSYILTGVINDTTKVVIKDSKQRDAINSKTHGREF